MIAAGPRDHTPMGRTGACRPGNDQRLTALQTLHAGCQNKKRVWLMRKWLTAVGNAKIALPDTQHGHPKKGSILHRTAKDMHADPWQAAKKHCVEMCKLDVQYHVKVCSVCGGADSKRRGCTTCWGTGMCRAPSGYVPDFHPRAIWWHGRWVSGAEVRDGSGSVG